MSHLFSAPSYQVRVGKLGSMSGELTSISSMGSDQDSNLLPLQHTANLMNLTKDPNLQRGFFIFAFSKIVSLVSALHPTGKKIFIGNIVGEIQNCQKF